MKMSQLLIGFMYAMQLAQSLFGFILDHIIYTVSLDFIPHLRGSLVTEYSV